MHVSYNGWRNHCSVAGEHYFGGWPSIGLGRRCRIVTVDNNLQPRTCKAATRTVLAACVGKPSCPNTWVRLATTSSLPRVPQESAMTRDLCNGIREAGAPRNNFSENTTLSEMPKSVNTSLSKTFQLSAKTSETNSILPRALQALLQLRRAASRSGRPRSRVAGFGRKPRSLNRGAEAHPSSREQRKREFKYLIDFGTSNSR